MRGGWKPISIERATKFDVASEVVKYIRKRVGMSV